MANQTDLELKIAGQTQPELKVSPSERFASQLKRADSKPIVRLLRMHYGMV